MELNESRLDTENRRHIGINNDSRLPPNAYDHSRLRQGDHRLRMKFQDKALTKTFYDFLNGR